MTSPDIPSLITKLRNAPQLVGTFGRGDPDPQDEYRPGMTGEERDLIVGLLTKEIRSTDELSAGLDSAIQDELDHPPASIMEEGK
jgi:hypothetical protein